MSDGSPTADDYVAAYALHLALRTGHGRPHTELQLRACLELPGPREDKSLKPGQVRVIVIDAQDRPVADQLVIVHSSEATGDSGTSGVYGHRCLD